MKDPDEMCLLLCARGILQCLLALWTPKGEEVKEKNQEGFQKRQKMGTSFRDGETLVQDFTNSE